MSYKFYWFIGLLDILVRERGDRIEARQIAISMVANAWYPVNFFHLELGWKDQLHDSVKKLNKDLQLIFHSQNDIGTYVSDLLKRDSETKNLVNYLLRYVPHRFLSPWFKSIGNDEKKGMDFASSFQYGNPYRVIGKGESAVIEINPIWKEYLIVNYPILTAFAYWYLAKFVQQRNPNVPNVLEKLQKPMERLPMDDQKKYWNSLIKSGLEVRCIYTDKILGVGDFDLDHFIPWSFVSHNLLWNLIPADSSINSSKSNKLPDLKDYLPSFARTQQSAIQKCLNSGQTPPKILEDYLTIRKPAEQIAELKEKELLEFYENVFEPLWQTARNVGFGKWDGYIQQNLNLFQE
ncbi:MAG: hypothetical protein LUC43_07470 [Burkholderiales bacterium]|nr:hypothetical protein [Burkholderiales bacterium]